MPELTGREMTGREMTAPKMTGPEMTGTVVVVQEGRLQLTDDQGVSHLFILKPSSGVEPQQLYPLQARQARVRIAYCEPRHVIGLLAERIDVLDAEPAA